MDRTFRIFIDHNAYYLWVPVKAEEVAEGEQTAASTYPGFVMRRTVVNEPTVTTVDVRWEGVTSIQDDQRAAGLPVLSHKTNLLTHLKDGPLFKHMPPGSITGVSSEEPKVAAWLNDYFTGNDDLDAAPPAEVEQ